MTPRRTRRTPAFLDETLESRETCSTSRILIYSHIESAEWFAEQPHGQTGGEPRLLTVNGRFQFLGRDRPHLKCHRFRSDLSLSPSFSLPRNVNFTCLYKRIKTRACARARTNRAYCIIFAYPSSMRSFPWLLDIGSRRLDPRVNARICI